MEMNQQEYDLIVVGGGLAGSALATSMARAGAEVLVLEKETQFRDRVRGEWLAPWGVKEVRLLGLEDALAEAGAHQLPALAGRSLKPRASRSEDGDVALTFWHPVLQEVLLKRAMGAGATVVRGAKVTAVHGGDLPAVGFATAEGEAVARARLVVGAEGRTSLVRQAMGLPVRVHRSPRLLAGVRLGGIDIDDSTGYFVIAEDAGGLVSLFPQGAGFARAYVFDETADTSTYAGPDGLRRFLEALVRLGVPAEAVTTAFAAGPLAAFVTDDTWVRTPAVGSLTLIGDAAGASDPTWGMGMALAMRDARTLAAALQADGDFERAAANYATARDEYFETIITAEHWLTEIQLTPGAEAAQRRKHIMAAWNREPDRAIDLPGRGPAHDVSEAARARVFATDIEAQAPVAAAAPAEPATPDEVAERFIDRLSARDFAALEALLGPEMRSRALLPGGPREYTGSQSTLQAFRGWFEQVEDFEVVDTGLGRVADRVSMRWQFRLRRNGEPFFRAIEQQAYAKVVDGRVVVLDMVCSGFRPMHDAA